MNCGKVPVKTRRHQSPRSREPITLSEPSEERLAAQKRIQSEKHRQRHKTPEISVVHEMPPDVEHHEETTEMEIKKEIKKEEENRNTRHQYKGKELDWLKVRYIHKDGSICNKERRLQKE